MCYVANVLCCQSSIVPCHVTHVLEVCEVEPSPLAVRSESVFVVVARRVADQIRIRADDASFMFTG
jgi:hypothetical protein